MLAVANVGKYCVSVIGDEIGVTDVTKEIDLIDLDDTSQYIFFGNVSGFSKFCNWKKGIAITLAKVEDMEVIYFIRKGTRYGESYALNLTEPLFSEYGDCGIVRE